MGSTWCSAGSASSSSGIFDEPVGVKGEPHLTKIHKYEILAAETADPAEDLVALARSAFVGVALDLRGAESHLTVR